MKPNLLVIQSTQQVSDPAIDRFCETLCETHYVYVIRPSSTFREDSPAGVRFLNYTPDRMPGFGKVESVVLVDGPDLAERVSKVYPTARQWLWDPEMANEFPSLFTPSSSDTIIQGDFGQDAVPFARAM